MILDGNSIIPDLGEATPSECLSRRMGLGTAAHRRALHGCFAPGDNHYQEYLYIEWFKRRFGLGNPASLPEAACAALLEMMITQEELLPRNTRESEGNPAG